MNLVTFAIAVFVFSPEGAAVNSLRPDQVADERPDRLEKKNKPADPPKTLPAESKNNDRPTEPVPDEDPAQVRERITKHMQAAEQKLKARDTGTDTRQLQDRVVKDIDTLIEIFRRPPPPQNQPENQPQSQNQQQQNQPSNQQQQSQPSAGGTRREQRQQRRQQNQPGRMAQQPQPGSPSQSAGSGQPQAGANPAGARAPAASGSADKMADVVKDIWGHLPETLRQEVDHYYRDQFMPRYRDLLQQYYSRLAEKQRREGDR